MSATWFKFYNDLVDDPRFVALSDAAWTLHIHGMAYCSKNLTDGVIPRGMIRRLCGTKDPMKAAKELVAAGMWAEDDDGWEVVDYLKGQRSKAQVEAAREANRERLAVWRAGQKPAGNGTGNAVGNAVTNAVSTDEVRAPDTDTDTDMTTSRLTGLSNAPVDNSDDWVDSHAKQHLAAHIAFRSNQIDKPKALARSQLPKIIDTIRDVLAKDGDAYDIDDALEDEWPTFDELYEPTKPASVRRLHDRLKVIA